MATRFFPPASSLHRDDYLEFAFRFNIRSADTGYPAAGEKNIPQNPAVGKKNLGLIKQCVTVNSKGLRCNDFSPSRTLPLIQNIRPLAKIGGTDSGAHPTKSFFSCGIGPRARPKICLKGLLQEVYCIRRETALPCPVAKPSGNTIHQTKNRVSDKTRPP